MAHPTHHALGVRACVRLCSCSESLALTTPTCIFAAFVLHFLLRNVGALRAHLARGCSLIRYSRTDPFHDDLPYAYDSLSYWEGCSSHSLLTEYALLTTDDDDSDDNNNGPFSGYSDDGNQGDDDNNNGSNGPFNGDDGNQDDVDNSNDQVSSLLQDDDQAMPFMMTSKAIRAAAEAAKNEAFRWWGVMRK